MLIYLYLTYKCCICFIQSAELATLGNGTTTRDARRDQLDELLADVTDITSGNLGSLCITHQFRSVPVHVRTEPFESARQKADLVARLVQDLNQLDNQGDLTSLQLAPLSIASHESALSIALDVGVYNFDRT